MSQAAYTPPPAGVAAPAAHASTHATGAADELSSTMVLEAASKRLRETAGPTILVLGAIADGQVLRRSGTALVGAATGAGTLSVTGDNSAGRNLTAAESGGVFYDTAGAGTAVFNLPAATVGLTFTFVRHSLSDNYLKVVAQASETIRVGSRISAAAGYARGGRVASSITLTCLVAGAWKTTACVGMWDVDGVGDYESWTPVLSWTGPVTPTGTILRVGSLVIARFLITMTGAPTGGPTLTIQPPTTVASTTVMRSAPSASHAPVGRVFVRDASVPKVYEYPIEYQPAGPDFRICIDMAPSGAGTAGTLLSNTAPTTLATGDELTGEFQYIEAP